MALPIQDTDREATAKARFIDTMREKANLVSFMSAFTDETQALEDAFFQIFGGFNLDTAIGAQLDGIGETIGLARESASDDTYRIRLRARILINLSSGTPNQILRLVNLLLPVGVDPTYTPRFPASFYVDVSGAVTDAQAAEVGAAMIEATDAGIATGLIYSNVDDDASFLWADSTSLQVSAANGWGSAFPAGEAWSLKNSASVQLNAMASGGGVIAVGGGSGGVDFSSDGGLTWSSGSIVGFSANSIRGLAYGGGNFVAVGDAGHGGYSVGAGGFTHVAITAITQIKCVAYGAGLFVCGGAGGFMKSSPTGATWTTQTSQFSSSTINAMTFANSLFVAVGAAGKISTSTNGTSWTAQTSGTANALNAVAYVNGLWVAVGDSGTVLTSVDGASWTVETANAGTDQLLAVGFGAGVFAVGGASGRLCTSPNGTLWTSQTSGFSSTTIRAIAGSTTAIIAAGDTAKVSASADGTTWDTATSSFTASNILVAQSIGDLFLIAGAAEKIAVSDNFNTGGLLAGIVSNT